jgi:hypothetical protein
MLARDETLIKPTHGGEGAMLLATTLRASPPLLSGGWQSTEP